MSGVGQFAPDLARGAWKTLEMALSGGALALVSALLLGLALSSRLRVIRWAARLWVEFFRGLSALVLLFALFYVLPLYGVHLSASESAALGLGVNIGAYGADVVRGAIAAVDKGQSEAALALNMSRFQTMRRIILPQAVVMMLPSLSSLQVILLKATSLASLISVGDLTAQANSIALVQGHRQSLYLVLLIVYFFMALFFSGLFRLAQLRLSRRLHLYGVGA